MTKLSNVVLALVAVMYSKLLNSYVTRKLGTRTGTFGISDIGCTYILFSSSSSLMESAGLKTHPLRLSPPC